MIKDDKIPGIQYLRGLAALGVVFCHFDSDLKAYPILSALFGFGQTGVPVFFLISGFIIVYSLIKSGYKPGLFFKFLLKRSIRIDPAYFVVILLTLALYQILAHIPSYKGDRIDFIPAQFIAHLIYVIPFTKYPFYVYAFWTLSVEFQFYLLIGLLYFISESKAYRSVFLVLFASTCFIPFSNAYYLVFTYAPIFALGISFISFYQNRRWVNIILPAALLVLVAYKFGIPIFILLSFSLLAILFFKATIKPLLFLGNISYSLYLTHGLVLIVLSGLFKKAGADTASKPLLWLFIEILVACIVAYILYVLVERPSINLSKRIFYKKQPIANAKG